VTTHRYLGTMLGWGGALYVQCACGALVPVPTEETVEQAFERHRARSRGRTRRPRPK
jgi:hypothetical protein